LVSSALDLISLKGIRKISFLQLAIRGNFKTTVKGICGTVHAIFIHNIFLFLKNTGIKTGFTSTGPGYRCVLRHFYAKMAFDAIN